MAHKEKFQKFYLLAALLLLALAGCTPASPASQTTPGPVTPSSLPATQTATPSPVSLTVEEYPLQGAPTSDPFSFTPQQGTMDEILARHESERSEAVVDNSFYTDDGQYAWRVDLGGDELVATENYSSSGGEGWVSVTRNGEEIYRIETGPASPFNALRGLWAYDDHWVLETASIPSLPVDNNVALEPAGQITQDGELLNERLGYAEMFGFQMMAGRPFYFFKQDGKISYAYDGQVVEAGFDAIPHYLCCSEGALNPRVAQDMVAFFARRGEQWSYVELGVFPPGAPAPTTGGSPTITREVAQDLGCVRIERLPPDSADAQQIVDEFVARYRDQYPTEYMGMAILDGVYRLGEWALVIGSIAGEGTDAIAVRQTPQGYQIADFMHVTPLESPQELQTWVVQPFLDKLPEAPLALFTCMDSSWLLGAGSPGMPESVYPLAYLGTDDFTTSGVTEITTIQSDGSDPAVLLHEPMLIMGLVSAPGGEQIAFWGCPGSLASDCAQGEDPDVWVVNWDGSHLANLTADSGQDDSHPDWSPDGTQIAFDSGRSGNPEVYIMSSDGSSPHLLTSGSGRKTEPKWSPDGKWIAYHCSSGMEIHICVVSPDGQPAGEPLSGTSPAWSPASPEGEVRLAFLCFQDGQSDLCTARPDGTALVNLTNSPSDEHSAAWSPDGNWIAFVSNRGDDVDIYKVCATCPGEPAVVRLTDEVRAAGWPAWSPDGSQVAYESAGDLLVVNADRSSVTFLASGIFSPPVWRP